MTKKKKSLVDKVKDALTKDSTTIEEQPIEEIEGIGSVEEDEDLGPSRSADFGIPADDEVLEDLKDE